MPQMPLGKLLAVEGLALGAGVAVAGVALQRAFG